MTDGTVKAVIGRGAFGSATSMAVTTELTPVP